MNWQRYLALMKMKTVLRHQRRGKGEPKSKGRHRLDPEIRSALIADFQARATIPELQKKYKLGYSQVYYMTKGVEKTPITSRTKYRCENNHEFVSNLPVGKAQCPDCHSKEVHSYEEPEVKEDITEEVDYRSMSDGYLHKLAMEAVKQGDPDPDLIAEAHERWPLNKKFDG